MSKKCPPGVICFENITILFIVVILISIMMFINTRLMHTTINIPEIITKPSTTVSNISSNDVFINPYQPPVRDNLIYPPMNHINREYKQIGILTRMYGGEMILPLMGKPIHVARDKWNFYTMKDSNGMVKLPISYKGKSCTNEYGCDNLYNGDSVYVEGYNDTFKVTIYDNQSSVYNPSL